MRRWIFIAILQFAACGPAPTPIPTEKIEATPEPPIPPLSSVIVEKLPDCSRPEEFKPAAKTNAQSLRMMEWAPYRRAERGWDIYFPLIAEEIQTQCGADDAGFAHALSHWQGAHKLTPSGEMNPNTFAAMKAQWRSERRYALGPGKGACVGPPESTLVWATKEEGYSGKLVAMRLSVLSAYRAMVKAARAEQPELAADPQMLAVFSGYRSVSADAERCARQKNCNGITRAVCSPHRTGLVLDMNVGAGPGGSVDSSEDANRLYQSKTTAYRWMVKNAHRFGFAPYPFEPWHWEYVEEAP